MGVEPETNLLSTKLAGIYSATLIPISNPVVSPTLTIADPASV